MWALKDKSGEVTRFIKEGQSLTIGRKETDIILSNDGSISRVHARIEVKLKPNPSSESSNDFTTICILTDSGSRYGTQILHEIPQKLLPNVPHNLKHDEIVQFGLDQHMYKVQYIPFMVLTSGVNKEDKIRLRDIFKEIGGEICTNWSENCTHLTVSEAKMTQKLATCLAVGLPIVTMPFWESVKNSMRGKKPFPKACDFCPNLDDRMMQMEGMSLRPVAGRRKVFEGLLFVFFIRDQFQIYHEMITLAGGTAVCYSDKKEVKKRLGETNTILVQFEEEDAQNEEYKVPTLETLQKFLRSLKRRLIPETDIPLAILHCSTKYSCNPDFKYHKFLQRSDKTLPEKKSKILALDTQDVAAESFATGLKTCTDLINNTHIIPETADLSTQELQRVQYESQRRSPDEEKLISTGRPKAPIYTEKKKTEDIDNLSGLNPVSHTRIQSKEISKVVPPNLRIESLEKNKNNKEKLKPIEEPKTSIVSLTNLVEKKKNSTPMANDHWNVANEQSRRQLTEIQPNLENESPRKSNDDEKIQRKRPGRPFSLSCIKRKHNVEEVDDKHPMEEDLDHGEDSIQAKSNHQQETCKKNNDQKRIAMRLEEDDEFSLNSQNTKKQRTSTFPEEDTDTVQQVISSDSVRENRFKGNEIQKRKSCSLEEDEEPIVNPQKKVKGSPVDSFGKTIKQEKDDSWTSKQRLSITFDPKEKIKTDPSDSSIRDCDMKTVWAPIIRNGPGIEKTFVKVEIGPVTELITSWKSVTW